MNETFVDFKFYNIYLLSYTVQIINFSLIKKNFYIKIFNILFVVTAHFLYIGSEKI